MTDLIGNAPVRPFRDILKVGEIVYGPFENIYAKQSAYLFSLGVLKGRPWGDWKKEAEIRAAADKVRGAA